MKLDEVVRQLTTFARMEDEMFAMFGGWVVSTRDPETKLLFAEQSHHHAWHASLWRGAVPTDVPFEAGGVDEVLTAFVASLSDEHDELRRLLGVARVLAPMRLGTYHQLLATLSPASDGPIRRAATLIVADQDRDRFMAEALLDGRDDEVWVEQHVKQRPRI